MCIEELESRRLLSGGPTADAGPDRLAAVGTAVKLNFIGTDSVVEPQTETIDWGDGSTPVQSTVTISKLTFQHSASHTYATRGNYTVTWTVSDANGTASDSTTVRVGDLLAHVIISGDSTEMTSYPDLPKVGYRVFVDLNRNGQFDEASELAALTDDSGDALFESVAPGSYSVRADPLNGYLFASPIDGVAEMSVSATTGSARSFVFTKFGVITSLVFNDVNGNGLREAGELPLAGQPIQISGLNGSSYPGLRLTTNANGEFRSIPYLAGTYLVQLITSSGYVQTAPFARAGRVVTYGEAQTVSGTNFGTMRATGGSISGNAWVDLNGNNLREANEPGADGRSVFLDANNDGVFDPEEVSYSPSSSSNSYSFFNLAAGTYNVRLTPRVGWEQTVSSTPARSVVLVAGQASAGNDFATRQIDFIPPTLVSATYFVDASGPALRFEFDEAVEIGGVFSVRNLTLNTLTSFAGTFDPTRKVGTYRPKAGPILSDGNYSATFASNTIHDLAGNRLDGVGLSFVVLAGDANGDARVDFSDLAILAQHYNQPASGPASGDFNFDDTVDFNDLVILAQRYNTTAATGALSPASVAAALPLSAPLSRDKRTVPAPAKPVASPPKPQPKQVPTRLR
jgi:PKD repeat protein